MHASLVIQLTAVSGVLAVALGAFGAHGLKDSLPADLMATYQTAVQYHFIHTITIFVTAVLMEVWGKSFWLGLSSIAFIFGIIIFSGSLYILAITGVKWLGAITPIGGLAFIVGWAALFMAALRHTS